MAEILIWVVNGASHDSSTEMTETLVGPEDLVDLVGKRCLHARSLTLRLVIPGFVFSSRRREIVGCAGSGLGHIAFGVSLTGSICYERASFCSLRDEWSFWLICSCSNYAGQCELRERW